MGQVTGLPLFVSKHAQEVGQINDILLAHTHLKALVVEIRNVDQRLCGTVVEVRRAGGKAAEDRSLELADMCELAVNQGLTEIRGRLAVVAGLSVHQLAYLDPRQVAHVEPAHILGRVSRAEIAGPDVQRRREGMVAHIRRVVAGAAGPRERGNAARYQSALGNVVIDPGYIGDGDRPGVENLLPACHRSAEVILGRAIEPGPIEDVEDVRGKHPVPGYH